MKQQLILNRRLNNINFIEQNTLLSNKIKKAKSALNLQCPESFTFFNSKHFKNGQWKNIRKKINIIFFYNI